MKSTSKNKIAHAAEAIIYKQDNKIIKDRIKKDYRISEIDKNLRKSRTQLESKIMLKALRNKINVPKIKDYKDNKIEMEFLDGELVKDILNEENYKDICEKIGKQLAKLHDINIVHGDLTTSNMIYKDNKVYFIDFGLAQNSKRIEDKAVDLYLISQALNSKHHEIADVCFKQIISNYKNKNTEEILNRLNQIEKRRRYKSE